MHGLKGPEKTKVRGQAVDKINESLGSHGGDRGSKPLSNATPDDEYEGDERLYWSVAKLLNGKRLCGARKLTV